MYLQTRLYTTVSVVMVAQVYIDGPDHFRVQVTKYYRESAVCSRPTAASAGFILGELGSSAALDEFLTVYELPLTHFEKRQTNKHTNRKLDGVPRTDLEWHLLLSYYMPRQFVCTTTCKGCNYCRPRDPASWQNRPLYTR